MLSVIEGDDTNGMKQEALLAETSCFMSGQSLPTRTFTSGSPAGFALVTDTHRRPEQFRPGLVARICDVAFATWVSRKPLQLPVGLHTVATSNKESYCCCVGMLVQVRTACVAPPEAPARRVLLLMIPRCLRTAADSKIGKSGLCRGLKRV